MDRLHLLLWRRPAGSWAAIVAMVVVAWSVTYAMGGSQSVVSHLFYVPVLFAAFRLTPTGAAIAAIAAGVAAGPLMLLSVELGVAQPWLSWTARTGAFLLVGLLTARMAGRLRSARTAEAAFAEERGKILQLVDHELRTPLTVIKGGARLLDASALPERVRPLVPAMEHAVARLEGLAGTVAASVAEEDGRDDRHDIRVDSVIASALAALPREARSRVSVYGGHFVIYTLRRRLKVALGCLIDNALRFSPDDRPVVIRASEDEDGCHIAVRDLGPGVPADRIEDLFEPFRQGDSSTTRRHDGLGLGLFAARRNVRHLGGDLHLAAPDDGPGLVATITVPRVTSPTTAPERPRREPQRSIAASWRRHAWSPGRQPASGSRAHPVTATATDRPRGPAEPPPTGSASSRDDGTRIMSGFAEAANQTISVPAVLGSLMAVAVVYLVAQQRWNGVADAFRVVPVLYVLVVVGALLCAVLLAARARLISDHRAGWVATGIALAGLAAAGQATSIIRVTGSRVDPDGLAALYLVWHAALVVFAAGAVLAPRAERLRWVVAATFVVGIAVVLADPTWRILPSLVAANDAFTPLYDTCRNVLTAATMAVLGLWVVTCGRRPTRPEVWIAVLLGLAAADMLAATGAERLFASIWWSSAVLQAAQFVIPAIGLQSDALRLVGLLHRHERSLTERLQHDRQLAAQHLNRPTGTDQEARRIRAVIDGHAYRTVFQPIYSLDTGQLVAVEALTRFTADPPRSPDQWFDEAKRCGLGVELELATLAAALLAAHDQLTDGIELSVNISPAALTDPRLHQHLTTDRLAGLIIEVTEHAVVDDYPALADALAELTISGVRVAIDDAGAGFSSLQHIIQLRPDIIKLDMSLTRDIHIDPVRRALATSLIDFTRQMGIELIAEGVETAEELDTLRQIGAHAAQGYLLAHAGDLPAPPTSPHVTHTLRPLARAR